MSPCYAFFCRACNWRIEKYPQTEPEAAKARTYPPKCPHCKKRMKRQDGPVSIRFKGKGWSAPSKFPEKDKED